MDRAGNGRGCWTDPLNAVSFGAGTLAGKLGRTIVQKSVIGAGAGATEGAVVNSASEYLIAKGQGKSDEEAKKIALQSAGGGAAAGTFFAVPGAVMSNGPKIKTKKLKDKTVKDILDNDLLKEDGVTANDIPPLKDEDMAEIDTRIKREVDEKYKIEDTKEQPEYEPDFTLVNENLPATLNELVEVELIEPEAAKQIEYKNKLIQIGHKEVIYADLDGWKESVGQHIIDAMNAKKINDMNKAEDLAIQASETTKQLAEQLSNEGADAVTIRSEINKLIVPNTTETALSKLLNSGMPLENRFSGLRLRDIISNTMKQSEVDPQELTSKLRSGGLTDEFANVVVDSIINKNLDTFDNFVLDKATADIDTASKDIKTFIDQKIDTKRIADATTTDKGTDPETVYPGTEITDNTNNTNDPAAAGAASSPESLGRDNGADNGNASISDEVKRMGGRSAIADNDRVISKFDTDEVVSDQTKQADFATIKEKFEKDIQDFGEKIGGARKDFSKVGMKVSDLDNMNQLESSKLVVKKNLWKPLDYKALKDDGYSPESASYLKRVKDALPTQPIATKEAQANYIRFVNDIKEVILGSNKDPESIAKSLDQYIVKEFQQLDENGKPYGGMRTWNDKAKLFTNQGILTSKFVRKLNFYTYGKTMYGGGKRLDTDWSNMIKESGFRQTDPNKPKIPKKSYLKYVKRDGRDWRQGKDIDETAIQDTFGFRAGEFGNWVNQNERQTSLNHAFDALMDLAEVLQVDPKAISLNGKLAIAFGSRGRGGMKSAAAHYEPERVVINLTKKNGAGTLAHEWLHALDNYIGKMGKMEQVNDGVYASEISLLRERFDQKTMAKYLPSEGINIDLVNAFKDLNDVIKQKELNAEEMILKRANIIAKIEKDIKKYTDYVEGTRSGKYSKQNEKNIRYWEKHIKDKENSISRYKDEITQIESGTYTRKEHGQTSFMNNAQQLDGNKRNPYWASTRELTARAFESYIFDNSKRSDYLVAGVEDGLFADPIYRGDPYPAGKERTAINKAFDELMDVVRGKSLKGFEKVEMNRFDEAVAKLKEEC